MPIAIPGSPFRDILNRTLSTPQRASRLRNAAQPPSVVPINSTLQSLTPSQLAALGVLAIGSGPVVNRVLDAALPNGLDDGSIVNPEDPGEFGEAGVNYTIRIFTAAGGQVGQIVDIYGPIQTEILSGINANGFPNSVWQFSGFNSIGGPRVVGSLQGSPVFIWNPDVVGPHTFTISPATQPEIELLPNPGTGSPILIPQPEPPVVATAQLAPATVGQADDLATGQLTGLETLLEVGAAVADIVDTIAEQFPCDVCALLVQIINDLQSAELQIRADIATFEGIRDFLQDTDSVELLLAVCGEDPPSNTEVLTDSRLDLMFMAFETIFNQAASFHVRPCLDIPGIPVEFDSQPSVMIPKLILSYREEFDDGSIGRVRTYTIPHASGLLPNASNAFRKGTTLGSVLLADRTAIRIYGETEQDVTTQLAFMAQFTTGEPPILRQYIGVTQGIVTNVATMRLTKAEFYANGTGANIEPTSVARFIPQFPGTINPPV